MAKIWLNILTAVQRQGLAFVLICGMTYYFQTQSNQLQGKVDLCNSQQMELYKEHAKHMEQVIERNSKAFENFSFYLKEKQ